LFAVPFLLPLRCNRWAFSLLPCDRGRKKENQKTGEGGGVGFPDRCIFYFLLLRFLFLRFLPSSFSLNAEPRKSRSWGPARGGIGRRARKGTAKDSRWTSGFRLRFSL